MNVSICLKFWHSDGTPSQGDWKPKILGFGGGVVGWRCLLMVWAPDESTCRILRLSSMVFAWE